MSVMRVTVLGCGSSPGVPRIGNDWGACDPQNSKNNRLRCSIMVEKEAPQGTTRVLIDTSPDLRTQMLREKVSRLDGVLYTHSHADHLHGIDDLRGFWIKQRQLIDVYADQETTHRLFEGFGYCFETPEGSSYPPILQHNAIEAGQPVSIHGPGGSISVLPFEQIHGDIRSLGFRIGSFAYSSDVSAIPDKSYKFLKNLDIWMLDALRYTPHPSHFSLGEAIAAAERVAARHVIFTHMHIDLDYEAVQQSTPKNMEPAFDGMVFEIVD